MFIAYFYLQKSYLSEKQKYDFWLNLGFCRLYNLRNPWFI